MARNDPYLPAPVNVADGSNATFDGSASSTDAAFISGAMGKFDATVYIDAWDGSTWQEVTQLTDASGNKTFSADWHTQFNRVYVAVDDRRLRIENGSGASGWAAVDGDER